jgi:hypothetical protein
VAHSSGGTLEQRNKVMAQDEEVILPIIHVELEAEEKKRIRVLRQQMRDAEKEIKQLQSITQRDDDMAEWKMISDLKQKFENELKSHPKLGRMSWKRFNEQSDYFIYALNKGQYTHYAVDDTAPWVQLALKRGVKLSTLEENAQRMRHARWERQQRADRAAKKKKQDDVNKKNTAEIKRVAAQNKKEKKERLEEPSKAVISDALLNG